MKKRFIMLFIVSVAIITSCKDSADSQERDALKKVSSEGISQTVLYNGYPFREGMALAKKEGKPVVLYFYTKWCAYCKAMDRSVFSDNRVIDELSNRFVYIRIDTESPATIYYKNHELRPLEFALMMGVEGFPTVVYLDKNLDPITKIPGYMQKEVFVNLLGYIGDECYKQHVSFDSYLKSSKLCKKTR